MVGNRSILNKIIPETHISISLFPFTTTFLKEVALLDLLYHLLVFILSWTCTNQAFIPTVSLILVFKITAGLHIILPVSIFRQWTTCLEMPNFMVPLFQSFLGCPALSFWSLNLNVKFSLPMIYLHIRFRTLHLLC